METDAGLTCSTDETERRRCSVECGAVGKDVHYTYKRGTPLTPEEIAMIEAARNLSAEQDEDNPEIDPVKPPSKTPRWCGAVAERNRRVVEKLRQMG